MRGFFRAVRSAFSWRSVRVFACSVTAACTLLMISCTGAPPRIAGIYRMLSVVDNRTLNARYEQLSFFVQAEDDDGFSDISRLYLINDRNHLVWTLTPDTWERRQDHNQQWIGSNDVIMADGSAFPRGEYRVVLEDLAGSRDERTFVLDQAALKTAALPFPGLVVRDRSVVVSGSFPTVTVTALDPAGSFTARHTVSPGTVPISVITGRTAEPERRLDLYVHVFDEHDRVELVSGPYPY